MFFGRTAAVCTAEKMRNLFACGGQVSGMKKHAVGYMTEIILRFCPISTFYKISRLIGMNSKAFCKDKNMTKIL